MKKLVAVLGSSRAQSASKKVAMEIIRGAKENAYEVVIYETFQMELKGCIGCGSCRRNGTDCIIHDGMEDYYNELHHCDALLITSPNYYSQVSGQMITFMNRHYCMTNQDRSSRLQPGIQLIGVFAQGAPENYEKYQANYDWYLSLFTAKGMELAGKIVVGGDSDLKENGAIMKKAFSIGKNLK